MASPFRNARWPQRTSLACFAVATLIPTMVLTGILAARSQPPPSTQALKCVFAGIGELFFTMPTHGNVGRVGAQVGEGHRSHYVKDWTGTTVFVELNNDGTPITLTSIESSLRAVHSRHNISYDGTILTPSQRFGRCEYVMHDNPNPAAHGRPHAERLLG